MRAAQLSLAVLIAMPIVAPAQDPSPQPESVQAQSKLEEGEKSSSCISNFTFSQEFLTRYPNAGGACREVKVQNGQKWARIDAQVVGVQRSRVTANFLNRYDKNVGTITFDAGPDARVMVEGHPKRFSLLKPRDKLSFWMPEGQVGFYAGPEALDTTKLSVVDTTPVNR